MDAEPAEQEVDGDGDTDAEQRRNVHLTIKKVGEDYERMKFNTAIASMMSLVNAFYAKGRVSRGELQTLLLLLSPVAPHISEEMNELLGFAPLCSASWPVYDEGALAAEQVEYGVQVNGKVRARVLLDAALSADEVEKAALAAAELQPFLAGKTVRKVIVVRNIVNIVVS